MGTQPQPLISGPADGSITKEAASVYKTLPKIRSHANICCYKITTPIMQIIGVCTKKSEEVAPLFKSTPTDYTTPYNFLMLTQGMSVFAFGPESS